MIKSKINGKRMFGMGMLFTFLIAAIFWQASVREGQAQSTGGFSTALFVVKPTSTSLTGLTSAATSTPAPIYADGEILTLDGESIGVWRVWGFKVTGLDQNGGTSAVATVNMTFELDGFNGTLSAQGTLTKIITDALTGDDVVTITGGTGTFRGANGEAKLQSKPNGTFVVCLQETKRR